jgi:heme/copper-type cytochrome/quinol oxidase subunit 2
MYSTVAVLTQDEYNNWLVKKKQNVSQSADTSSSNKKNL